MPYSRLIAKHLLYRCFESGAPLLIWSLSLLVQVKLKPSAVGTASAPAKPRAGYMSQQQHVSYYLRAALVDWLVEVGEVYRFRPPTLFLAVGYIDRFLSVMNVQSEMLQLAGITCAATDTTSTSLLDHVSRMSQPHTAHARRVTCSTLCPWCTRGW